MSLLRFCPRCRTLTYQENWREYRRCVSKGKEPGCGIFIPIAYGYMKNPKVYTAEELGLLVRPREELIFMGNLTPDEAKLFAELYPMTVEQLLERVARGNDRLMEHYDVIKQEKDNDTWGELMDNFFAAVNRLKVICDFLVFRGWKDCLYMKDGKKMRSCLNQSNENFFCWVCPSEKKYWEAEIFGTAPAMPYVSRHGAAIMKFIKAGGKL